MLKTHSAINVSALMVAISRSSDTESLSRLPHLHTAPFTPATKRLPHLFSRRAAVALHGCSRRASFQMPVVINDDFTISYIGDDVPGAAVVPSVVAGSPEGAPQVLPADVAGSNLTVDISGGASSLTPDCPAVDGLHVVVPPPAIDPVEPASASSFESWVKLGFDLEVADALTCVGAPPFISVHYSEPAAHLTRGARVRSAMDWRFHRAGHPGPRVGRCGRLRYSP